MYKESVETGVPVFDYNEKRRHEDGYLTDVMDGSIPKEQMADMHQQYLAFKQSYAGDTELHEVSLLLSLFYDGDKLYDRSNDSLWPLMMSIFNCDPSFRTKLGLGLFMVSLHNMTVGSGAEQAMIDNLLTEELKQLENGILLEFTLSDGTRHSAYLQARVVYFHLDTRAYEKVYHCSATSLNGCPNCLTCHGLSRMSCIGAQAYVGHTLHLPDDHILRHIGESAAVPGYFGECETRNQELGKEISAAARACVVAEPTQRRIKKSTQREALPSEVEDLNVAHVVHTDTVKHPRVLKKDKHNKFVTYKLPPSKSWISTSSKFEHFAEAGWLAHNDNRPFAPYKRVSHESYMASSFEALNQEVNDFIRKGGKLNKNPTYVVNGIHSRLSAWVFLKAPRFEWSCYDMMHYISNCVGYYMQIVKGDRGLETKSRKLSVSQKRFTFLKDLKIAVPWTASKKSRILADSIFKCMNIPKPYKGDYYFDLPFHHSGYMNSHQKLVFMSVFAHYFFSFTDMTLPYKRFFARYVYLHCLLILFISITCCGAVSGDR